MKPQLFVATRRLQHFCRTCTTKTLNTEEQQEKDTTELQSIYELITIKPNDSDEKLRILELLNKTVPKLYIEMTDKLPKSICKDCIVKILEIYEFQQMCIESNKILHQLCLEEKYPLVTNDATVDDMGIDVACSDSDNDSKTGILKPIKNDLIESEANDSCDQYDKAEILKIIVGEPDVKNLTTISLQSEKEISNKSKRTTFRCDQCLRIFFKATTLEKHKKLHNSQKQKDADENVKREQNENDEKLQPQSYNCNICNKTFQSNRCLDKHRKQHLNDDKKMYKIKKETQISKQHICQYCHKAFQQSGTLKDHLRTHTGEQPYLCSECGKAFKCSSNMRQHLLRHSGEKRYECPDCPKKFPCATDLASHKAVHLKIKPHVCDMCDAAFGKPCQLKKHKMYHNNEKPHKCEYCNMRFVCSNHMRRHMRTHTGEKPYKCKYCERAFVQSNDLIKHLRLHLGENVYKCELCPATFRLASELRIHFAEHKNDSKEMRDKNLKALKEYDEALKQRITSTLCLKVKPAIDSIVKS